MTDHPDVAFAKVTKRYGATLAVADATFAMRRGEVVSLLGPSGCGKTTTLRMLAGLVEPSEGEIFVRGAPITRVPVHRRNVGMLFQNYALFPHMTVLEEGLNRVAATIEQVVYRGLVSHYYLALADGRALVAFIQNGGDAPGDAFRPGMRVTASWRPERLRLVADA